jgi:hypothetical protein
MREARAKRDTTLPAVRGVYRTSSTSQRRNLSIENRENLLFSYRMISLPTASASFTGTALAIRISRSLTDSAQSRVEANLKRFGKL